MSLQSGIPSSDSTASSLLLRAKNREETAWKYLVQLYGPLVYYWCRKSQLQQADAADAVQEVFHGVSVGMESFQRAGSGSFRGWLRIITRNKVADFVRRTQKQPQGTGGSTAHAAIQGVADPLGFLCDESSADLQKHDDLNLALESLRSEIKDSTWQIFWRTTVEEHDPAQVAADLGMKLGTVYQAKSRSLARLREILDAFENDSAEKN